MQVSRALPCSFIVQKKGKLVRSALYGRISPSGSLTQVRKPPVHRPCCVLVTHILVLGADIRQTGQSVWPTQLSPPPQSETPPKSSNLTRSCRKRLKTVSLWSTCHLSGCLCLGVSGVWLRWGSRKLQRCSPGSFRCWHETLGERLSLWSVTWKEGHRPHRGAEGHTRGCVAAFPPLSLSADTTVVAPEQMAVLVRTTSGQRS